MMNETAAIAMVIVILATTLAAVGCAASHPEPRAEDAPAATARPAEASDGVEPFMFREASLPKGFPGPGPVGKIVIKEYPAYRHARIGTDRGGPTGGANSMFRPLFNHIQRNDIPMTAPVEIGYPDDASPASEQAAAEKPRARSMAFLYAEPTVGTVGPDGSDPRVAVEDVPAMTVLSIAVRGNYTDENFAAALAKLRAWIDANPGRVRVVGPPRFLGYNSPFVPGFLKLGEAQIPVERLAAATRPAKPSESR